MKRITFIIIATIFMLLAIMWFATTTGDDVRDMEATQTERANIPTYEAEFHATLTAEANE